MCELLVGLPDVNVTAVDDRPDGPIVVHIEARIEQLWCVKCGARAGVKERPVVEFVDLPCSGGRRGLAWRKHRLCCRETVSDGVVDLCR